MLILPKDDKGKARELLKQAIADKFTITMLVFGEGNGEDQIISKIDVRAQAMASTRRVVWIRDLSILNEVENKFYRKNNNNVVACVLNLDDEPVVHLTRDKANSFVAVERAFLEAQKS